MRSEEDFPLNSESDVSGASFSNDDDISEASDDHMSTISIENSAGQETDGDNDQAIAMNPAGIEAGVEINLGFKAPGDSFLEGSPATDGLEGTGTTHALRTTPGRSRRVDRLPILQ